MLRAGFDYSWSEASFALAEEDGTVLFDKCIALPPRNASGLPAWMEECLKQHNAAFQDIGEWSVGVGPGSFTGLRLASSFVMGLAFGRDNVRCRGVSTAAAMAATAGMTEQRALALFDGRRDELLAFGLKRDENSYRPDGVHAVLGSASLELLDKYDAFVCLSRDEAQIRKVGGASIGEKLRPLEHLKASGLIFSSPGDFSTTLKDLVYLRPAVFVEPRIPRTL